MPCATSSIPYTGGVQEADRSLWGCSMATSSITGAQGAQEQVTVGASLFQFRSRGLGKAGNNISFSGARGLGKREILFPFPVHVAQGSGKYDFRFRCTCREGRKGPKCSRFRFRWQEVVQGTYSPVEGRVQSSMDGGVCLCSLQLRTICHRPTWQVRRNSVPALTDDGLRAYDAVVNVLLRQAGKVGSLQHLQAQGVRDKSVLNGKIEDDFAIWKGLRCKFTFADMILNMSQFENSRFGRISSHVFQISNQLFQTHIGNVRLCSLQLFQTHIGNVRLCSLWLFQTHIGKCEIVQLK